ncbi:hypothetical protein FRC09_011684 [Ceratobasidium sp. 395]|nr:hypothetical protein FRC09_011684 [Ceratobasidium sp. 395]
MGGSVLPWDSSAYCNLVELKLQFVHCKVSASESQLAALLSASPGLVTLKLAYIPVTRARGWTQPSPVQLNCLKVLDVVNMEAGSLELLLPLFAVPESSDDLSVGVPFDQRLQNALETFFARSQITTLHCCRPNGRPAPSLSLLRSLACVETVLILDRLLLNENNDATSLEAPGLSLIPSLIPNVILVSCKVTFEGLKDLVEAHQIRNLRLQLCRLIYSAKDSQSLEDIQASLLGMYPDLKVSIEDRDSTYDHPVRRWDEYN